MAVQIAASALLVAVALGATSSLHRLLSVDLGFRPEHVLAFQVGLDNSRYPQHPQRLALVERIVERVHRLGAVVEAGAVDHLPLVDSAARLMRGHGRTLADSTLVYAATPGFFQAFGVPLVAGRALTWDDVRRQEKVALVSEACARRLWGSRDPLGEYLPARSGLEGHQVIGVTCDIRRSYGEPLVPTVFVPFNGGWSSQEVTIVVKVQGNGQRAARAVEPDIRALVPDSYVSGSRLRDRLDRTVARPKASAAGMSVLACLSAVLAAAGLVALIGHEAARRRVESSFLGVPLEAAVRQRAGASDAGSLARAILAVPPRRLQWSRPMCVSDTDPDAERVQVRLLRAAGVSCRLAIAVSLSDTVRHLALRAIKRVSGATDETEARLWFVEFHHGRALADAVRACVRRLRE